MLKKLGYIPALLSPYLFLIGLIIIEFDLGHFNTNIDNIAYCWLAYFVSFNFYCLISRNAWKKLIGKSEDLD